MNCSLAQQLLLNLKQTMLLFSVTPSGGKGLDLTFNHPGESVWHRPLGGQSVGSLVPAAPWKRYQPPDGRTLILSQSFFGDLDVVLIFLSELFRVLYRWHGSTEGQKKTPK